MKIYKKTKYYRYLKSVTGTSVLVPKCYTSYQARLLYIHSFSYGTVGTKNVLYNHGESDLPEHLIETPFLSFLRLTPETKDTFSYPKYNYLFNKNLNDIINKINAQA